MRIAKLPDDRYPAISDLAKRARKKIPHFAWEYLDSATGEEAAMHRNREALSKITFVQRFMKGKLNPDTKTKLFDVEFNAPFGIAPIGYTSLIWPGAEQTLARTAAKHKIPHCLSTVASDTPENCGPLSGNYGWFQLYPPKHENLREDMLKRVKDCGYHTLVITADLPWPSMRERQRRAGITIPPKITPKTLYRVMKRPHWMIKTLLRGKPTFSVMEKYAKDVPLDNIYDFVSNALGGELNWDYFKQARDIWDGPVVLKGILSPEDAKLAVNAGADGIWVSNHGGRQFEAAPSPITVLPEIVKAVNGKASILFDSGIRSGGDIMRALRLGADFVFLGRPFMYGVAALGEKGGDHVYSLIYQDVINNMHQMGIENFKELLDIEIVRY